MHERTKKQTARLDVETKTTAAFDIDALLHPARAFSHPSDVVSDPDLTLNEKRAILSSWASDACAVEAAPELRANIAGNIVRWDDIMDALRELDREATTDASRLRAQLRKLRFPGRSGGSANHGPQLC